VGAFGNTAKRWRPRPEAAFGGSGGGRPGPGRLILNRRRPRTAARASCWAARADIRGAGTARGVRARAPRRHEPHAAASPACWEIFAALAGIFIFTTGDLIEHAALSECANVVAALVAATGSPLRSRRVGKWLRGLSGRESRRADAGACWRRSRRRSGRSRKCGS